MKLWHKKATWIMVALLLFILIGIGGIMKFVQSTLDQPENQPSWEENEAENKAFLTAELANPNIDDTTKKQLEKELAISEYRIEKDLEPMDPSGREQSILDSHFMLSLVVLLSVIAAAGIVASEFSQGTIKMLLSRPVKRWKILTSKYLTTLLFALMLTMISFVASLIAGYLFYDPSGGAILDYRNGAVVEVSYWGRVLALYALQFVGIIVYLTFAFMIGSVFRSSSLAIGLSIFLLFVGPSIVLFLSKYEFVKYILFTHTDLTGYISGNTFVPGLTWPLSLVVLTIYMLLFLVISFWSFTKRDVTA
ncbi:ABC transporter permease [Paenisporosarcina sp. OV554]|uniref:ABC transporter permease n=1 Tax=Paenisporosarcina sp. OV554 TaxID=2135694 RepID=UPI001E55BE06|nr:ABC transporter permease subunit [Paenisporosarcina sp. OV554]